MQEKTPLDYLPAGVRPADIFLPPTQPIDITSLIREQHVAPPVEPEGNGS